MGRLPVDTDPRRRLAVALGGLAVGGIGLGLASFVTAQRFSRVDAATARNALDVSRVWVGLSGVDHVAAATVGVAIIALGAVGYGIRRTVPARYRVTDAPAGDQSTGFQFRPRTDGHARSEGAAGRPGSTGVGWDTGFLADVPLRRTTVSTAAGGDFLRSPSGDGEAEPDTGPTEPSGSEAGGDRRSGRSETG